MQKVTERVFVATDVRGCNYGYVVTEKGAVMVDTPQLPTKAVALREEVLGKGPIRYLINTEHHIDHIFGNHYFAGICPVIGHELVFEDFWTVPAGDPYTNSVEIVCKDDPQGIGLVPPEKDYVVNAPNILFREHLTLRLGGHIFELLHTPGHSRGQSAVYVPQERVVFVGDTIFCQCQTWLHAADPDAWLWSLDFIQSLDVDHIIPGHGPVCNKSYISEQSAFIREWVTAVAIGISKGWDRQECMKRISFLDRYPVDVGQESMGPLIQQRSAGRIFDILQGKVERFPLPKIHLGTKEAGK